MRRHARELKLGHGIALVWMPRWQVARGDTIGITLHREWSDRYGLRVMLGPAGDLLIDWPKTARAV
jgi:hypothetical protein